ncbi:MAG: aspartate/glutamate racemase family protein, partial [Erysipelotrichaceae bacterium]|nr:aspartate/glutamate racemase family protein [Erysipelotrichaceae bacterium]
MKNGYLGIYDSGIGGLTVVKAVQEAFPHQNVIFLADSKNMPYGSKTPQQIVSYSLNNVSILNRYPLKAILIACNTSDSIARKTLQEECDLPIFGVIDPAARKAVSLSKNRRIAVLATQAT